MTAIIALIIIYCAGAVMGAALAWQLIVWAAEDSVRRKLAALKISEEKWMRAGEDKQR